MFAKITPNFAALLFLSISGTSNSTADVSSCESLLKDGIRDHMVINETNYEWTNYHNAICNDVSNAKAIDASIFYEGVKATGTFSEQYKEHMCGEVDYQSKREQVYSFVKNSINTGLAAEFNTCVKYARAGGIDYSRQSDPKNHTLSLSFRDLSQLVPQGFELKDISLKNLTCNLGGEEVKNGDAIAILRDSQTIHCDRTVIDGQGPEASLTVNFSNEVESVVVTLPAWPPIKPIAPAYPIRLSVTASKFSGALYNLGVREIFDATAFEVQGPGDVGIGRCTVKTQAGLAMVTAYAHNNNTGRSATAGPSPDGGTAVTEVGGPEIGCVVLKRPGNLPYYRAAN